MTATLTTRTTETAFREALEADPSDCVTRLVLADWLDEQGRDVEANGQRWQVRNRQWPCWSDEHQTWDWWLWEAPWWPSDYFNGIFEASLPRDVWCALESGVVKWQMFLEYGTLREAEIALALALFSLDL